MEVDCPFILGRLAGRNDARHTCLLGVYDGDHPSSEWSERDEAAFTVVEALIIHQHCISLKDIDGIPELNAVLAGIAEAFLLVPLVLHVGLGFRRCS